MVLDSYYRFFTFAWMVVVIKWGQIFRVVSSLYVVLGIIKRQTLVDREAYESRRW